MIDLQNERVLVIGGGTVAERKISALLPTGADITVISPSLSKQLNKLVKKDLVHWIKRTDVNKAFFVIAATNDRYFNDVIITACTKSTLVLNVSHHSFGNVMIPSVHRDHSLTIAVSTDGKSPHLVKRLCERLFTYYEEKILCKINRN